MCTASEPGRAQCWCKPTRRVNVQCVDEGRLPADGMSAATEKGTSARPSGQLFYQVTSVSGRGERGAMTAPGRERRFAAMQ